MKHKKGNVNAGLKILSIDMAKGLKRTSAPTAAGVRGHISTHVTEIQAYGIQIFGGNGHINECALVRLWRDATLYEISVGTATSGAC